MAIIYCGKVLYEWLGVIMNYWEWLGMNRNNYEKNTRHV